MRRGHLTQGLTLEASVLVRHVARARHILHSPHMHAAIAAATGHALSVLTCCAAQRFTACKHDRVIT